MPIIENGTINEYNLPRYLPAIIEIAATQKNISIMNIGYDAPFRLM